MYYLKTYHFYQTQAMMIDLKEEDFQHELDLLKTTKFGDHKLNFVLNQHEFDPLTHYLHIHCEQCENKLSFEIHNLMVMTHRRLKIFEEILLVFTESIPESCEDAKKLKYINDVMSS